MVVSMRVGQSQDRDKIMLKLVNIRYSRTNMDLARGTFRVSGDVLEIFPVTENESVIRVEFFGDEIEKIATIHPVTGEVISILSHVSIYPAMHHVAEERQFWKRWKQE